VQGKKAYGRAAERKNVIQQKDKERKASVNQRGLTMQDRIGLATVVVHQNQASQERKQSIGFLLTTQQQLLEKKIERATARAVRTDLEVHWDKVDLLEKQQEDLSAQILGLINSPVTSPAPASLVDSGSRRTAKSSAMSTIDSILGVHSFGAANSPMKKKLKLAPPNTITLDKAQLSSVTSPAIMPETDEEDEEAKEESV
jgi:hypothetical protein